MANYLIEKAITAAISTGSQSHPGDTRTTQKDSFMLYIKILQKSNIQDRYATCTRQNIHSLIKGGILMEKNYF